MLRFVIYDIFIDHKDQDFQKFLNIFIKTYKQRKAPQLAERQHYDFNFLSTLTVFKGNQNSILKKFLTLIKIFKHEKFIYLIVANILKIQEYNKNNQFTQREKINIIKKKIDREIDKIYENKIKNLINN